MATATDPLDAASVARLIETGYSAADQSHSRVRSFRNIVLVAASVLTVFLDRLCGLRLHPPERGATVLHVDRSGRRHHGQR